MNPKEETKEEIKTIQEVWPTVEFLKLGETLTSNESFEKKEVPTEEPLDEEIEE